MPSQASPLSDAGPTEASFKLAGLSLHLRPSASQQQALDRLLSEQQDPASPGFRKWLKPEQFADRFGASRSDIATISAWLETQGFHIDGAARGRSWITFHGDAGQVRRAFHTEIHKYNTGGKIHFANTADPAIPAALQDIVSSLEGLDDFTPEPRILQRTEPEQTSGSNHYLAPNDLATIYNVAPLYQAGVDGTGQTIAIAGSSSVDLANIQKFRTRFNLPDQNVQTILVPNLPDPGVVSGARDEAYLDLQWAGAVARNASIVYVYSSSVWNAARYVIDQNLAPVLSVSFSRGCEQTNTGVMQTYRKLAQQAAAEGITWVNASGDAGAAGCDGNGTSIAQNGLAVRFPESIPEITAVGGTQFSEGTGNYWNTSNDANGASALSYIPESAWNEYSSNNALWAGGGGASMLFPKPSWQKGLGVPNDGARDLPDVALSAASHDGFIAYSGGTAYIFSGTSASAPAFAGMLVLLNQYLVSTGVIPAAGLGNVNPMLYQLAQTKPESFHDIVTGGNQLPCVAFSPNCSTGSFGYSAGPGYDLATGLGSPDLYKLVHNWSTQPPSQSLVVASLNKNPVYQQTPDANGNGWAFTVTLNEQAGVPTTITEFTIDNNNYTAQIPAFFGSATLPAHGSVSVSLGAKGLSVPAIRRFHVAGMDASGRQWSEDFSVPFLGFAAVPAIAAAGNGASYQQVYAPGMVMTVYGLDLAPSTQAAGAVPLLNFMGGFSASVNGFSAPLYYVSPTQVNVQIPYETAPGLARLTVVNGQQSATYSFQVAAAAPGIFTGSDGSAVPYAGGKRGDTLVLYITGEGLVTPRLATGASPSPSTPLSSLPKPVLPVSLTIGGVPATIQFAGIPPYLVGVTQINFTVPPNAPLGTQSVVVTVGGASSSPAKFTVTQ